MAFVSLFGKVTPEMRSIQEQARILDANNPETRQSTSDCPCAPPTPPPTRGVLRRIPTNVSESHLKPVCLMFHLDGIDARHTVGGPTRAHYSESANLQPGLGSWRKPKPTTSLSRAEFSIKSRPSVPLSSEYCRRLLMRCF